MKTRILYSLSTMLMAILFTTQITAQQGSISHDSNAADPTLELIETGGTDFSRLYFTNEATADSRFSLAGRNYSDGNADFGLFYNGSYRWYFEEDPGRTTLRPIARVQSYLDVEPLLELDIDNDNAAKISFIDNVALPEIGQIRAFTNQNGSAIPHHVSYMVNNRGTGAVTNAMTMWDSYTTFGSDELISGGGSGRVVIAHNSSGTNANLRLVETSTTDYARIGFSNAGSTNYFNISARPGNADPELSIAYNGSGKLIIVGDENRIGVMDSSPTGTLHIKQQTGDKGLVIENDGAGDDEWAFEIGTNDLSLYRDNIFHGTWDDATLGVYGSSDRRLKNSIEPMEDGMLEMIDQLVASKYYFNHDTDKSRKAYGFIAQDVQTLMPELVKTRDTDHEEDQDLLMLNYTDFTVMSIKAIQELNDLVKAQAEQLTVLQAEMASMKASSASNK